MAEKTEIKLHSGRIIELKQETREGEPVGLISGLIATFDIDRGDFFGRRDQFVKGAFLKSIAEHKARDNRQVRFKDQHGRTIGGFPIEGVHETEEGLFGTAEINLTGERGRELFSLAKQRVLVDFSIGFIPVVSSFDEEEDLRTITEAVIIEGSIVDEPMNIRAKITSVKSNIDKIRVALENDNNLTENEVNETIALLTDIKDNSWKVDLAEVKSVTDQKGIEKLLKKCGFSQNAATTLVKLAKEFKSDNQGDPGDGNDDDQGDPGTSEVLKALNDIVESCEEKQIIHELNQITQKVT